MSLTSVNVDDELARKLKSHLALKGISLKKYIADHIENDLGKEYKNRTLSTDQSN